MIGYYVHHVGQGHAYRALAVAAELRRAGEQVSGLSSLPRPRGWVGDWCQLPRDDTGRTPGDPTAGGRLHWVPVGDVGLKARMAAIAAWIDRCAPSVFVSDLSVEVTVLARLHGVPVVTTVLPGRRDDAAHQLGFDLAELIIAPWPDLADDMCRGLERHAEKVMHIGGLSRFDQVTAVTGSETRRGEPDREVLLFAGAGHRGTDGDQGLAGLDQRLSKSGWRVRVRAPGRWAEDPWPDLCSADVVVTHAGLGTVSDIAAARRPAVVVAEPRPHDEQTRTAAALRASGLALVLDRPPVSDDEWTAVLERARTFDPQRWTAWSRGDAAARFAAAVLDVADRQTPC